MFLSMRISAAVAALPILAACGGGGGGSPTAQTPGDPGTSHPPMVAEPMPPAGPVVDGSVTVANASAIDPTLAFRRRTASAFRRPCRTARSPCSRGMTNQAHREHRRI